MSENISSQYTLDHNNDASSHLSFEADSDIPSFSSLIDEVFMEDVQQKPLYSLVSKTIPKPLIECEFEKGKGSGLKSLSSPQTSLAENLIPKAAKQINWEQMTRKQKKNYRKSIRRKRKWEKKVCEPFIFHYLYHNHFLYDHFYRNKNFLLRKTREVTTEWDFVINHITIKSVIRIA